MGIHLQQATGWRRGCALLCLFAFLSASVVHAAHICPEQVAAHHTQAAAANKVSGSSLCLTCAALQSSSVEPSFGMAAVSRAVYASPFLVRENPRSAVRFFRLFVRPPPAA